MLHHQISNAMSLETSLTERLGRLITTLRRLGASAPMPTDPRLLRDIGVIDDIPSAATADTQEAAMQLLRNI